MMTGIFAQILQDNLEIKEEQYFLHCFVMKAIDSKQYLYRVMI